MGPRDTRNPLAAALAAMAVHAAAAVALGWPYPSLGTVASGLFALLGSAVARRVVLGVSGSLLALAPLGPEAALALLAPLLAGAVGWMAPSKDPLRNLVVALPSLTAIVLALAL